MRATWASADAGPLGKTNVVKAGKLASISSSKLQPASPSGSNAGSFFAKQGRWWPWLPAGNRSPWM